MRQTQGDTVRILAVDTSGKEIGIGVFDGQKCLFEGYMTAERAYNRHIMPLINRALDETGLKLADVDVFAAALGPGSFTGIRVGMSVMKAFAHALNKKFSGASTLDIMAESAASRTKGKVWAILEAGRGELYAACYKNPESGVRSPESRTKYMLVSKDVFIKKLRPGDAVAGLGGENILVELAAKSSKISVVKLEHVEMGAFARLVEADKGRGNKAVYTMEPVYIRPSEAEARLKMKKKAKVK
jgi:tRNA threonylcarbamoyladenosine biosynthesis protein TsaB